MSASDSAIPFSTIDIASIVISDGGSNSKTLALAPGSTLTWAVETPPYVEVRHQNKHTSGAPTVRKTGDSNVTGKISAYVSTFYGSADESIYEVLNGTGTASGWSSTGTGDKPLKRMVVTYTAPSGASQTMTFAYCAFTNIACDWQDDILMLTADFTDHENSPTPA